MSPSKITDAMIRAAAEAVSRQLDGGYRGHWCAEWAGTGGCVRCREIATEALIAAGNAELEPTGSGS